jgi:hypothetical protein
MSRQSICRLALYPKALRKVVVGFYFFDPAEHDSRQYIAAEIAAGLAEAQQLGSVLSP